LKSTSGTINEEWQKILLIPPEVGQKLHQN